MSEVIRTERGWPGHFIAALNCQFRRNTLLEHGERRIVVSTVGRYAPADEYQTIGLDRYAETMAFEAERAECGCWVADVTREVSFYSPWSKNTPDLHGLDEMHEAVIDELAEMMC
jgi:hypothetical protein